MNVDARIEAWVRLHAAAIPAPAMVALLRAFDGPDAVLGASAAQRRTVVSREVASRLEGRGDGAGIAASLAWLAAEGHHLVAWGDADYPAALLEIADPPAVLFALGRLELLRRSALAIVGSRNATPQGVADAEAFAGALSAAGLTIVSGMAVGIDAAAHRGGLAHESSSIAVVGTGLDRVYPAANRALAHELGARGLIVSQFAPGTPARKHHFPLRNRLVSGLARGVLVIEATLTSGSLITARLAAEQGRDVFAVPGSIHSPFSKGCHRLLREGAKLVETADDVLAELQLPTATPAARASDRAVDPDPCRNAVLAALGFDAADVDTIAARSGLAVADVVVALTSLELDRRVAPIGGGLWQRAA